MDEAYSHKGTCPSCGSPSYRSLGRVPVPAEFCEAIGTKVPETVVVRCWACGLFYLQPMPSLTPAQYDRLYDLAYFQPSTARWQERRREDGASRLDEIQKLIGPEGELLDLGCGEGGFLAVAKERGYECQGLEVSEPLAQLARSNSGVPVEVGPLEEIRYEDSRFSAIYMDSVLEHIPQPGKFLREAARVLRPGGVVYAVVPNEDGLFSRIRGIVRALRGQNRRLTAFSLPYHWLGFNRPSLVECFQRAGFELVFAKALHGKEEIWKYPERLKSWKWWILHTIYVAGEVLGMGSTLEALFRKPIGSSAGPEAV